MHTRLIGTIAIAALALTACGGGDGDGSAQDELAQMMIDELGDEADTPGVTIDEACIRDTVGQLSDDDARAILDAGPDGTPEVSAQANEIATSVFDCVEIDPSAVETDG